MADTSIGKAYVQIVPTAKGISSDIENLIGGDVEKSGESAGASFGSRMLGAVSKLGIAAAVGKIFKDSIAEGANLQQSFGGLDTIYGDAADAAKEYAYEAAKAGISANDYAEQAVSFGASLKQAFKGDTVKAVEAANTAIMDMTDNAAKMGTPIENIQNAYQGFAKQNYTMLDNLKLGYGGTKEEMQRLLSDAQALSGVEYNIDNLGDVYDAIHVIQEDLGLTGVAAEEAATTFSGSFGAMKAAAANVLGNLALGEDVMPSLQALGSTIKTFVVDNAIPMIGNLVRQIPSVVAQLPSFLADMLPSLWSGAADIVTGLAQGIIDNIPAFIDGIGELVTSIPEAFMSIDWGSVGSTLLSGLTAAVAGIWDGVTGLLSATFGIEMPDFETVVQDISGLWDQVKGGITGFFQAAFSIITDDDKTITEKISGLWDLVKESIGGMFKAVFSVVMPVASQIISSINTWWGTNVWPSIQGFFKAAFGLDIPSWEDVKARIEKFWKDIKSGVASWFKVVFGVALPSLGTIVDRIKKFWDDISSGIVNWFKTKFKITIPTWGEVKQGVKSFWDDFKQGISGFFKKTFTVVIPAWEGVQSSIKTLWNNVKSGIGSIFSWLFNLKFPSIDDIVQDLKNWWDGVVKGIGDFFTLKWAFGNPDEGEVYENFSGAGHSFELNADTVNIDSDAIQKALSDANLTLADVDTSSIDKAKEAVRTALSEMEKAFKNARLSVPGIKRDALPVAKQAVSSAVAAMKQTMQFTWSLPTLHGRLPVISVSMHTATSSDGKTTVSYPELNASSFKWFKEGGIFSNPTVIGIGDTKGPEAALPLDPFWKRLHTEIRSNSAPAEVYITNNISGAEDPEAWGEALARQLKLQLRMA